MKCLGGKLEPSGYMSHLPCQTCHRLRQNWVLGPSHLNGRLKNLQQPLTLPAGSFVILTMCYTGIIFHRNAATKMGQGSLCPWPRKASHGADAGPGWGPNYSYHTLYAVHRGYWDFMTSCLIEGRRRTTVKPICCNKRLTKNPALFQFQVIEAHDKYNGLVPKRQWG